MKNTHAFDWLGRGWGLFVLLVSCAGPATALQLPTETLRYTVNYTGNHAGELAVSFEQIDDQFVVTTTSYLSPLAKLFLSEQISKAYFQRVDNQLALLAGEDLNKETRSLIQGFEVNRDQQVIVFTSKDPTEVEHETVLEADNFPLILITSAVEQLTGQSVLTVSGKRARWYRYLRPERETLVINQRKFDVLKVKRQQHGNPDRTTTFWLDIEDDYLPVRIMTQKKGKKTILTRTD